MCDDGRRHRENRDFRQAQSGAHFVGQFLRLGWDVGVHNAQEAVAVPGDLCHDQFFKTIHGASVSADLVESLDLTVLKCRYFNVSTEK